MQKLPKQQMLPESTSSLDRVAVGVPSLSPALALLVKDVQRSRHNRDAEDPKKLVVDCASRMGIELSPIERDEVLAYLEGEAKPFGILQSLVDNPAITDIIITNYAKVSVQQGRRNFPTDLKFSSTEDYEAFVEKLLATAETSFSTRKPIADGMIGSFARIHAVHSCLCETGPYLTIRLNRYSSVSCDDLENAGLAPRPILTYLSTLVKRGLTLLVVGEVGTGKTTLVRALAAAIPRDESILTIEDTPEIKLSHPHVRYLTTREANSEGSGRIVPSECIRAGMRMAMNRIIFGEIRDAEAAEAFVDVCASGHPGLSTIHARSARDALSRLELFLGRAQRGVDHAILSEQVASAVHAVVYVNVCNVTGARRIFEVHEIGGVADGAIRYREMFRYQVADGHPGWRVVTKASTYRDQLESDGNFRLADLPGQITLSESITERGLPLNMSIEDRRASNGLEVF